MLEPEAGPYSGLALASGVLIHSVERTLSDTEIH
jgi:hypothetical protein